MTRTRKRRVFSVRVQFYSSDNELRQKCISLYCNINSANDSWKSTKLQCSLGWFVIKAADELRDIQVEKFLHWGVPEIDLQIVCLVDNDDQPGTVPTL